MLPPADVNPYSAIEVTVHGLVQGVGFRYFTQRNATRLGLVGWVRNLPDGNVQVYAEGRKFDLETLLKLLRQGPTYSSVTQVDVSWVTPKREAHGFRVVY